MHIEKKLTLLVVTCVVISSCSTFNYLRGGIYRDLDPNLTIVRLTRNPNKYLNKEFVFAVRYYKIGKLPCPLGDNYVNFSIADRESYITLDKIWIKKSKASVLEKLDENQIIVVKVRVFKIDEAKDPNVEALEIVPERKPSWWERMALRRRLLEKRICLNPMQNFGSAGASLKNTTAFLKSQHIDMIQKLVSIN